MAGRYEASAVFTAFVYSLATVFALAPFFHVIAAVLVIAEIAVGKGDDDASILSLAVLAIILNILSAVASIFLCTTTCIYAWRRRPPTAREEEKLVPKKEESKFSETETKEEG